MGTYDNIELVVKEDDIDIDRITKEEALDLIGSGIPIEEIVSAFPTSFKPSQLRAFKAHMTMGRYSD